MGSEVVRLKITTHFEGSQCLHFYSQTVHIYLPVNIELQLRRSNLQQHHCESLKPHTELGVTKRKQINYI